MLELDDTSTHYDDAGTSHAPTAYARPRKSHRHVGDRAFAGVVTLLGGSVLVLVGIIVLACAKLAAPAFAKLGFFHFLAGSDWNPVEDSFGALPFIYGTLVTSAIAIVLALPVGGGGGGGVAEEEAGGRVLWPRPS